MTREEEIKQAAKIRADQCYDNFIDGAKWADTHANKPLDITGVKWKKREKIGYEDEMGLQLMGGVGYVVYDQTHYIPWKDLQKLPREI